MTCPARVRIVKDLGWPLGEAAQELTCAKAIGHKGAHAIKVPPGIRIEGTKGTWTVRL